LFATTTKLWKVACAVAQRFQIRTFGAKGKMFSDHYKILIASHGALVTKMFSGGLTAAENFLLQLVRAQIDRLEEELYRPDFEQLEKEISVAEEVAALVRLFVGLAA
jgi:hypothetical protein